MARLLPRLRTDIEVQASPLPDRPGLLVRDPFRFSDATMIIPPLLVECLHCFDGDHTELDLRAVLTRLTGEIQVGEVADRLIDTLAQAGFLVDEHFQRLRLEREDLFAASASRPAVHSGGGYPAEAAPLREALARYLAEARAVDGAGTGARTAVPAAAGSANGRLRGVAAPHVSPWGGADCYGAAYGALATGLAAGAGDGAGATPPVFVILGTSHYGEPERYGLTCKPFVTPLGPARTDEGLVRALARAAGDGAKLEDYCHAVEHSIEFQVIFLQHLFGAGVSILPILCGPLLGGSGGRGRPEESERVARFIGALGELAAREEERLVWVLGVDMTHIGRRYGDALSARADDGPLQAVANRDRGRLDRVAAADADGFWQLVHENKDGDDLKWCGASSLYTFLRAVPQARGDLLRYQQWNIDDDSVVSFAAMAFR
jgi:AmmeMemoRadiSam system protein B